MLGGKLQYAIYNYDGNLKKLQGAKSGKIYLLYQK